MAELNLFSTWGVEFVAENATQSIGQCIFCGKREHFYANLKNELWDCKRCGKSGNRDQFLEAVYAQLTETCNTSLLQEFADKKKLTIEALKAFGFVATKNKIVVPYRDATGRIVNLRYRKITSAFISTKGCRATIFNVEDLLTQDDDKKHLPVFVTEGETDCVALDGLLRKLSKPGIVIGVPGAGVYKADWLDYFYDRDVVILFDKDKAGQAGREKLAKALTGIAASVRYVEWPEILPDGYDIRDHIVRNAEWPERTYDQLKTWYQLVYKKNKDLFIDPEELARMETPTLEGLKAQLSTIIKTTDDILQAFEIMLATVISIRIPGRDQLWMFLVGPPGGGKSTLLTLLNGHTHCLFQSSLRGPSLISGFQLQGKSDPSILANVNDKALIIKDFTEVLSKSTAEKDLIFSILRDAYDGFVDRTFGNHVHRSFNVKFTILAGVTGAIKGYSSSQWGERFLRYHIRHNGCSDAMQQAAVTKSLFGDEAVNEFKKSVQKFLLQEFPGLDQAKYNAEKIPPWFEKKVRRLAEFAAKARTSVVRDPYSGVIQFKPEFESPNRLTVQLNKLALALAHVRGTGITEEIYAIVKKVAFDTVDSFYFDVLHFLFENGGEAHRKALAGQLRMGSSDVYRYTDDLKYLGLVEQRDKEVLALEPSFLNVMRQL